MEYYSSGSSISSSSPIKCKEESDLIAPTPITPITPIYNSESYQGYQHNAYGKGEKLRISR